MRRRISRSFGLIAVLVCTAASHRCSGFALRQTSLRGTLSSPPCHQARRRTSPISLSATATKGQSDPALQFVHPETNVTVILLGCLHGSASSSQDVGRILGGPKSSDRESKGGVEEQTDVLVLELCAGRFADMTREMDRLELERIEQQTSSAVGDGARGEGLLSPADKIGSFINMVRKTSQKRGISAGIAAAILGGVSGVQAALSGFDPGSEFAKGLELARSSNSGRGCDVVLADRTVDETLRRVGSLPAVSAGLLTEFVSNGWDWDRIYGTEAQRLRSAIWGDVDFMPAQVDMGRVLTRSDLVRGDLLKLTLPTLLFTEAITAIINTALDTLTGRREPSASLPSLTPSGPNLMQALIDVSATLTSSDVISALSSVAIEVGIFGLILAAGYALFVLPAMKLIISERDEQLAQGIRAACKLAVSNETDKGGDGGGRVVAILGLLHVNGVAQRLLSSMPPSSQETEII